MMSKVQFGLASSAPSRAEKGEKQKEEPGFAAALDEAKEQEQPDAEVTEKAPRDEAADDTTVEAEATVAAETQETEPPATLAQLVMPSERPRPPETKGYDFAAVAAPEEPEVRPSVASGVEVDVDLSMFEPTSRPPTSSLPPSDRGLDDLTAAELATGFEMPWKAALPAEVAPATIPMPATQLSPGVRPDPAPPTRASGTPPALVPEGTLEPADADDRPTAPAPHRASLHDSAIRDALHRSTQPSMEAVEETTEEAAETETFGTRPEAMDAEPAEVRETAPRRTATLKAFAAAGQDALRERLSATRIQSSTGAAQLADEQVQQRQEAATSAVNHMTLRHFAQADIDHPELGRIRVAARTVAGEVDVEMTARDANTVAVLQSTTGQLSSELRQASVELRDLDVRHDEEAPTEGFEERPGHEAEERSAHRERPPKAAPAAAPEETADTGATDGSSVRIVL